MTKRKIKNCCAGSTCPACECCICICTKDLKKVLTPEALKLIQKALV